MVCGVLNERKLYIVHLHIVTQPNRSPEKRYALITRFLTSFVLTLGAYLLFCSDFVTSDVSMTNFMRFVTIHI
jgi:hypothetical protein